MNRKIGELIGWIIVAGILVCILLLTGFGRAVEPSFIVQGVTAGPTDNYVFAGTLVPRDLIQSCTASETAAEDCRLHQDLVALNNPAVDTVLIAHHQVITKNGMVIFNYAHANPRQ